MPISVGGSFSHSSAAAAAAPPKLAADNKKDVFRLGNNKMSVDQCYFRDVQMSVEHDGRRTKGKRPNRETKKEGRRLDDFRLFNVRKLE